MSYKVITPETGGLIKSWTEGVLFEDEARKQAIAVIKTKLRLIRY